MTATSPLERAVGVGDQKLLVHDEPKSLYGGAVHYWRLDRGRWSQILDEVKAMGFTTISTYIPWEVHEVARGTFDFEGNKDIDAFLTLIEEKGLDIVVRPGPRSTRS
jgi:beta-galactosidase